MLWSLFLASVVLLPLHRKINGEVVEAAGIEAPPKLDFPNLGRHTAGRTYVFIVAGEFRTPSAGNVPFASTIESTEVAVIVSRQCPGQAGADVGGTSTPQKSLKKFSTSGRTPSMRFAVEALAESLRATIQ